MLRNDYRSLIDTAVRIMRERGAALRELQAVIEEHHNGYDPTTGYQKPATHRAALLDLIHEQRSLEGYEAKALRSRAEQAEAEVARLQAIVAAVKEATK